VRATTFFSSLDPPHPDPSRLWGGSGWGVSHGGVSHEIPDPGRLLSRMNEVGTSSGPFRSSGRRARGRFRKGGSGPCLIRVVVGLASRGRWRYVEAAQAESRGRLPTIRSVGTGGRGVGSPKWGHDGSGARHSAIHRLTVALILACTLGVPVRPAQASALQAPGGVPVSEEERGAEERHDSREDPMDPERCRSEPRDEQRARRGVCGSQAEGAHRSKDARNRTDRTNAAPEIPPGFRYWVNSQTW
jgi:hypothetical protein